MFPRKSFKLMNLVEKILSGIYVKKKHFGFIWMIFNTDFIFETAYIWAVKFCSICIIETIISFFLHTARSLACVHGRNIPDRQTD